MVLPLAWLASQSPVILHSSSSSSIQSETQSNGWVVLFEYFHFLLCCTVILYLNSCRNLQIGLLGPSFVPFPFSQSVIHMLIRGFLSKMYIFSLNSIASKYYSNFFMNSKWIIRPFMIWPPLKPCWGICRHYSACLSLRNGFFRPVCCPLAQILYLTISYLPVRSQLRHWLWIFYHHKNSTEFCICCLQLGSQ